MPRSGPRAVRKYSDEFKLTAVRLSQQRGVQVKTVAAALEIHPFMLSKWRKDARDGRLRGKARQAPPPGPAREIAQLQALERKYAELQEEHELLKKGSSRNSGDARVTTGKAGRMLSPPEVVDGVRRDHGAARGMGRL